jgi:leader peptidase (prepilin peptidase) / N-methyltransferase
MIGVIIFVLGLIVGSFLNAVIYRLSVNKSVVYGRSFCPTCKHDLGFMDLFPVVSYLMQKSRCRYCKKKISSQYPLVELATGLTFVLLFLRLSELGFGYAELAIRFGFMAVYTAFLIVIFMYDLKHYLILDKVILPAIIVAALGGFVMGYIWWHMVLAALVAGGLFAAQFALSRGRWIGGGDIRLGVLMGLMVSWPVVLVALFLAYMIGSIIGVGLIISGKKSMGSKVPFGTFLTVATYISLLYGPELLEWYTRSTFL